MKKIILLIIIFYCINVFASTHSPRYLIKSISSNGYIWQTTNEPYVIIEEICWNSSEGFGCDERLSEKSEWLYEIIDFDENITGSIYENSNGCYVFWWINEYGEDNNPHVHSAFWIECL